MRVIDGSIQTRAADAGQQEAQQERGVRGRIDATHSETRGDRRSQSDLAMAAIGCNSNLIRNHLENASSLSSPWISTAPNNQ
jgi:hypothetical protein